MVNTFQLFQMVLLEMSVKNLVYTQTTEGHVSYFVIAQENSVTLHGCLRQSTGTFLITSNNLFFTSV